MVELRHADHDAVADLDVLGQHGAGGEEQLGRRAVGIFLEEVVLYGPHVVEAQLVGQLHLFEAVVVDGPFLLRRPRTRNGNLVEQAELHPAVSLCPSRNARLARGPAQQHHGIGGRNRNDTTGRQGGHRHRRGKRHGPRHGRRFLADGAKVVVADLNEANGAETLAVAKANGHGNDIAFVRCDVANEADVAALIAEAEKRFGRLDIAYLNAGVGGAFGPIAETSVEDWDYTFAVLTRSVFLGMKHASLAMKKHGNGGVILVTASIAGMVGGGGSHAYSAAKAAVISLIENVAAELGGDRIRVVGIAPGVISTPLVHRGRPENTRSSSATSRGPTAASPTASPTSPPSCVPTRPLHHRRDHQGRRRPSGAGHCAVGHGQGQHFHEKRGREPRHDRRGHGRAQPEGQVMSEAEKLHRHLIGQQDRGAR